MSLQYSYSWTVLQVLSRNNLPHAEVLAIARAEKKTAAAKQQKAEAAKKA